MKESFAAPQVSSSPYPSWPFIYLSLTHALKQIYTLPQYLPLQKEKEMQIQTDGFSILI